MQHSNQIENENHFLFHCDRYKTIRQQITSDIVLKYPLFNLFNDTEKTIFLFNNADSFICKKEATSYMKHCISEKHVILFSLKWLVLY